MLHYPLPFALGARLAFAILQNKRIDLAQEARRYTNRLHPEINIVGVQNIPTSGHILITINHYFRPGFRSWWLVLSISAAVPGKIHWITSSAWTFPDKVRSRILTPITHALFTRMAKCFDFTAMPPMPPRPQDLELRANAVRHVLQMAQRAMRIGGESQLMIGIAPEGGDMPGGILGSPPPGVGRFIEQITRLGFEIVPVGIYEEKEQLYLNFGARYPLMVSPVLSKQDRDREASKIVMEHIATLVPEEIGYRFR